MYKKHKISVSVPAYQEENLIQETLKGIPDYVDSIVVVNDGSTDKTREKVLEAKKKDKRIIFLDSKKNEGIGATIIKAHKEGIENNSDIIVVMAGDNQMDPDKLSDLLDEIIEGDYDYVKGNRFFHTDELKSMPKVRLVGNIFISLLAKFGTGYWSVADPLNGYTALKSDIFKKLDVNKISKRFDFEISMLANLNIVNAKVKAIFIPSKYGEEKSKIKGFSLSNKNSYLHSILRTYKTVFKGFFRRIFIKNLLFNFSPIVLFYTIGALLFAFGLITGILLSIYLIGPESATTATVMISVVPFLLGVEFLLQAISLDIYSEPKM